MAQKRPTLEELRNYLHIDKMSLDDEIERQASLYYEVGEEFALAAAERDALKEEVSRVEAELARTHRKLLEEKSLGGRVTNEQVSVAVTLDPEQRKASDDYIDAKLRADKLAALQEAFKQRGYMLREMANLYVANYFARDSMRGKVGDEYKNARTMDTIADARERRRLNKE